MRRRLPNISDTNKQNKHTQQSTSSISSSSRSVRNFLLSKMPSLSKSKTVRSTSGGGASASTTAAAAMYHDQSLGMTQRRGGSTPTPPANLHVNDGGNGGVSGGGGGGGGVSVTSPKSPIVPMISDFMFHDDEYGRTQQKKQRKLKSLLLNTNMNTPQQTQMQTQTPSMIYAPPSSSSRSSPTTSSYQYQQDSSFNPQCCARFCTFFSFIAILFLITVGTLIEVQPLYIKGISSDRVPISFREMRERQEGMRLMNMNEEIDDRGDNKSKKMERQLLSYVHYSGRLRMLQSYYVHQPSSKERSELSQDGAVHTSYDDDPDTKFTKYNDYLRALSDEQKQYIIYEMKSEAKVSFKAAALYFVIMVFCIIYTHNTERVHMMFVSLSLKLLWVRLKFFIFGGGLRRLMVSVYHASKRRGYSDIPERSNYHGVGGFGKVSMSGSGTCGGIESITNRGSASLKVGVDKDYTLNLNNSSESMTGLSMSDGKNATAGCHFEQQEQQHLQRTLSGDSGDKPKKR